MVECSIRCKLGLGPDTKITKVIAAVVLMGLVSILLSIFDLGAVGDSLGLRKQHVEIESIGHQHLISNPPAMAHPEESVNQSTVAVTLFPDNLAEEQLTTTTTNNSKQWELYPTEPIEINSNSTLTSDILALWHNPKKDEVCIHLRGGSRCPRPSLVGRLSGESIAMLRWTESIPPSNSISDNNTADNATTYCGSYANSWLSPGIYFLEVIIIHCRDFGIQALNKIRSTNHTENDIQQWRSFDFTHECVEDPARHRITANSSYITIAERMAGRGNGFWLRNRHNNTNTKNGTKSSPWFTRYQPQGCLCKNECAPSCIAPMDNSRINEYAFAWVEDGWIKDVEALQIDLNITSPASIYSVGKMYSEPISREFDEKSTMYIGNGSQIENEYESDVFYGPDKICLIGKITL